MSKKLVLVIDEDSRRAEGLLFVLRLAGYDSCLFLDMDTALNWVKHLIDAGEPLCLLINDLEDLSRAKQTITKLGTRRPTVPTILVQRGKDVQTAMLALADHHEILICEPATVMNTLEILTAVQYAEPSAEQRPGAALRQGEILC